MSATIYSVDVPATSANIGPGFDCFGIALQLYNKFLFRMLEGENNKLYFRANFPLKQNPRTNLVYKAFLHTFEYLGYSLNNIPSIEISVLSDIPSARGLGSSATAVVAGVLAAGAITGVNLRLSQVIELATSIEGHPDNVAPAILGGMTISIHDKQGIYTQKLEWPDELAILVGIPDTKVRTQSARRVLPKNVSFEDAVFNLRRSALLIGSLAKKDWRGLSISMNDKLHQNARATLIPGLNRVLQACQDSGAVGAVLSGSGPCILAVALASHHNSIKAIKNSIINTWRNLHIESEVKQLAVQRTTTKIKRISEEEFNKLSESTWETIYTY